MGLNVGTWKTSWVPRLWKTWSSIALFAIVVVAALSRLSDKTPISHALMELLEAPPSWPLWQILSPSISLAFAIGALLILLMKIWDKRRIDEAEAQLKISANEKANSERELQKKSAQLENLEGLFRERERIRRLDHITGIPNYLAWKDDLKQWEAGNEKELCLILIDIDKLRWLNSRSPECADKVLRYFAQNTYSSMRRDEQIYKANVDPELPVDGTRPYRAAEMYRHYQGGDEFFFIISGNVYSAIGFINRLADRVRSYQFDIRETFLGAYLKEAADVAAFRLSFCGVILPHNEPETALRNAYAILARAKESTKTRLLVVFDKTYEEPRAEREKLEKWREGIRKRISELDQKVGSGDVDSVARQRLLDQERELNINITILLKAEQAFAVQ